MTRILGALSHGPPASPKDLAERFGASVGTVAYHVRQAGSGSG